MTAATLCPDGTQHAALRSWARGLPGLEAAVELLLRSCGGRLADWSWPWIRVNDGCLWFDPDQISTDAAGLSQLELRVLTIAETLASGRPIGHLADLLRGLDRGTLRLVLAAFSHAGDSHTRTAIATDSTGMIRWARLDPIVGWAEP